MLTKKDVIEILRREQPYLKANFGVARMAIFGSFAKDLQREDSDVDIFIEFEKPIGLKFLRLVEYLEQRFGKQVDVLTPGGMAGIRLRRVAEDIRRSLIYV